MMDATQVKVHNIMKEANLEAVAQQAFDMIAGEVADYAEAIAVSRSDEKGVEDHESHDTHKIYEAAETMIINTVIDHLKKINNKIG